RPGDRDLVRGQHIWRVRVQDRRPPLEEPVRAVDELLGRRVPERRELGAEVGAHFLEMVPAEAFADELSCPLACPVVAVGTIDAVRVPPEAPIMAETDV